MSDENEKQDRPSKAPGSAVAKSAVVRTGAQRRQRMLPLVVWSCLLLFQLGVLYGFWGLSDRYAAVSVRDGNSPDTESGDQDETENRAVIDRGILNALDNEKYPQVLDRLLDYESNLNEEQSYWQALAREGIGDSDSLSAAKQHYRKLATSAPSPLGSERLFYKVAGAVGWGRIGSEVGIVRQSQTPAVLESQQELDESELDAALCDVVLRSGNNTLGQRPSVADAFSLLGRRLWVPGDVSSRGREQATFEMPEEVEYRTIMRYLTKQISTEPVPQSEVSFPFGFPFDFLLPLCVSSSRQVSAVGSYKSVEKVIRHWEAASDETAVWADQDAINRAKSDDVHVRLNLFEMPREAFLTCVLRRVGLTWVPLEERKIRIQAVDNNQDDNTAVGLQAGQSTMQLLDFAAQQRLPATPLGDFLRLRIAKESYEAGQLERASEVLSKLCQSFDSRVSSYAAVAHYNLGVVHEEQARQLSESSSLADDGKSVIEFQEKALRHYRRGLENWPSRELQLKTRFAIGRLWLHSREQQERARGTASLQRLASDIARFRQLELLDETDSDFKRLEGRAAVLTAMSYLHEEQPSPDAEAQLQKHVDAIVSRSADPTKRHLQAVAALVNALAVFPETSDVAAVERLKIPIRRALEAVSRNVGTSWFGQCGTYWIAEGYWKLGIPTAAMAFYQESLQRSPHGHWSEKMRERIIQYQLTNNDPDKIQEQFEKLISGASVDRVQVYQIKRVELFLENWEKLTDASSGWQQQCLKWSRDLANTVPPDQKQQMLNHVGHVYEKMDMLEKALQCFKGGELPLEPGAAEPEEP